MKQDLNKASEQPIKKCLFLFSRKCDGYMLPSHLRLKKLIFINEFYLVLVVKKGEENTTCKEKCLLIALKKACVL